MGILPLWQWAVAGLCFLIMLAAIALVAFVLVRNSQKNANVPPPAPWPAQRPGFSPPHQQFPPPQWPPQGQ